MENTREISNIPQASIIRRLRESLSLLSGKDGSKDEAFGSRQRKRSQTTVWSKNGCYIACQSGLSLIERLSTEAKRFLNVSLTRSRASRKSQPSGASENFLFSDSAIETPFANIQDSERPAVAGSKQLRCNE